MITSLRFRILLWSVALGVTACNQTDKKTATAHTDSVAATKPAPQAPDNSSATLPPSNGNEHATNAFATGKPANSNNPSLMETYGRYMVKSGYIEMESTVDIDKDYHTLSITKKTFDNYGRDELMEITNETTTNGDKKTESQRLLMRAGWLHNLRPDFIAARQHPYTQFDMQNMEFSLLDAEAMHLYNIKNLGYQMKDGRNCIHYYIDYHAKDNNMKGDMWTYKNIFYGMNVFMNDANIRSKITRMDENVAVDQKKFEILAGYRVIDADNLEN